MKLVNGIWLPDGEKHMAALIHASPHGPEVGPMYQRSKILGALEHVREFRVAVDVGANCGLWSMVLVKHFAQVHAFEPLAENRACFERNVGPGAVLHACALGDRKGRVALRSAPGCLADSWVAGEGEIPLLPLDELGLVQVDFIKIDCAGYEELVLAGAEATLERCRPVLVIDQKVGRATRAGLGERGALRHLESLGARVLREMSGDFVVGWEAVEAAAVL